MACGFRMGLGRVGVIDLLGVVVSAVVGVVGFVVVCDSRAVVVCDA